MITDNAYQEWCRSKPCVVCGGGDWDMERGEYRNEYSHIRLGGVGGIGQKPKFSGVPCCHSCHSKAHQKGHAIHMPTEDWIYHGWKHLRSWLESA